MTNKLVTSGAMKRVIDKTIENFVSQNDRLNAIENQTETVVEIDQPVNKLTNVGNMVEVTKVTGNTMRNIVPITNKQYVWSTPNNRYADFYNKANNFIGFKANTIYTIFVKISNYSSNLGYLTVSADSTNEDSTVIDTNISICTVKGNGVYYGTYTPTKNCPRFRIKGWGSEYSEDGNGNTLTISNVMILEGDWTNKQIPPYFEGIQSVDEVEIKSIGKNMFDGYLENGNISTGENDYGQGISYPTQFKRTGFIPVKPNTNYTLSMSSDKFIIEKRVEYNKDKVGILSQSNFNSLSSISFITSKNTHYLKLTFKQKDLNTDTTIYDIEDYLATNIMVEEGANVTTYEPYQETVLQIPITEPLRKLPNGVADEIIGNKIIRKVGKVVLDGTENWVVKDNTAYSETVLCFDLRNNNIQPSKDIKGHLVCDKLPVLLYTEGGNNTNSIRIHGADNLVMLFLEPTKLTSTEVAGAKEWLNNNNLTIYYELTTPIEEEIVYNEILETYPNGNILLNGTVLPTVTVEYETGLVGKVGKLESEVVENRQTLHKTLTSVTGLETFTEPVNDLTNVGNVTLENVQGRTLQNIFPLPTGFVQYNDTIKGYKFITETDKTSSSVTISRTLFPLLKFGTTYTVIANISKNTLTGDGFFVLCDNYSTFMTNEQCRIGAGVTGIQKFVFTTKDYSNTIDTAYKIYINNFSNTNGEELWVQNIMILEGDYTNEFIPYFTGIQSTGDKEGKVAIKTTGKNLLNLAKTNVMTTEDYGTLTKKENGIEYTTNAGSIVVVKNLLVNIPVKPNTPYTLTWEIEGNMTIANAFARMSDQNGKLISVDGSNVENNRISYTVTTFENTTHLNLANFYPIGAHGDWSNIPSTTFKITNIMLYEGIYNELPAYEPYQESVTEFPIEPLRKLPNGVCDEIVGNKIIRRITKKTLTGSELWYLTNATRGETYLYGVILSDAKQSESNAVDNNLLCNSLSVTSPTDIWNNEMLYKTSLNNGQNLHIRTEHPTQEEFVAWIETNEITIYYQLATPIVEEIPTTVLATYPNGHFIFDNEITPTQAIIKHVDSLIARIEQLETTQQADNETLRNLCAVVDVLCLQIGELLDS